MQKKIKPRLPVILCDPGCRDKRGHHYEFNTFLSEICSIEECHTNIHSLIKEYKKAFYHSPYSIVPSKHKHIYLQQIEKDAQTIARLSHKYICILHSVSGLFLDHICKQEQINTANLIVLFPASDGVNVAVNSSIENIILDDWYKHQSITNCEYASFPRRKIWFKPTEVMMKENMAILAGALRKSKLQNSSSCSSQNFIAKTMEQRVSTERFIFQILSAEYLWCGFGHEFENKPSNTVNDGIFLNKKLIASHWTKSQIERTGRYQIAKNSGDYLIYEPKEGMKPRQFVDGDFIRQLAQMVT